MNQRARWIAPFMVVISFLAFACPGAAVAQGKPSGAKAEAPKKGEPARKQLIDNESTSVIEVNFMPGDSSSSRARPGRVIHYFTSGELLLTFPDGKTELRKFKAGETAWRPAETCEVKNTGKSPVRLLQMVPKSK
jgi:hypothetical protein